MSLGLGTPQRWTADSGPLFFPVLLCCLTALPFSLRAVFGYWDQDCPEPSLLLSPPTRAWHRATTTMLQQVLWQGELKEGILATCGIPWKILEQAGDARTWREGLGDSRSRGAVQGSRQPWDRQLEHGREHAFWDKSKPSVHRRSWPDTSLGKISILYLLTPGVKLSFVSVPLHATHGVSEKCQGGGWSKTVGTHPFQSPLY